MAIKQFADTSAVSIGMAVTDASKVDELPADLELMRVPFTTESMSQSREAQKSTAITNSRRYKGQKNIKGTAGGGFSSEMGFEPVTLTLLSVALRNEWKTDATVENGMTLVDGETPRYLYVEKIERGRKGEAKWNYLQRFFGQSVSQFQFELSPGGFVIGQATLMGVFADTDSADGSVSRDNGSKGTYVEPIEYEFIDGSASVKKIVVRDQEGNPLEATFSQLTISINNNTRNQDAVGEQFTAGIADGKVDIQVSGTMYFYDQSLLMTHIDNATLAVEIHLESKDGTFILLLPKLGVGAPGANAQGENQDYTQSVALSAFESKVTVGGEDTDCAIVMYAITNPDGAYAAYLTAQAPDESAG